MKSKLVKNLEPEDETCCPSFSLISCVTWSKLLDILTSFSCAKQDNMYKGEWCKKLYLNKIKFVKALCGMLRTLHMLVIFLHEKEGTGFAQTTMREGNDSHV